ncbi:unnamed protein product [Knipowitschia caucasica]|uniref:PX domain-containing protein n=1 Tax=Knipowitschia caucasica TaxID=637954 RepID=A0AAV2JTE9_KNICA
MVSTCVPLPFPDSWIKERWTASKILPVDKDRPFAGVSEAVVPCSAEEDSEVQVWTTTVHGYKILKKRTKFTVYKILVNNIRESWIIFRSYSDFCKLNKKLKDLFPSVSLPFPPKHRLKNNFEGDFLKLRQTQLQLFLAELTSHTDLYHCDVVKYFLHQVNSPDLFESLDESRAFCDSLEEMNHCLQRALSDKQRKLEVLRETLEKRDHHLQQLMKKVKY